jgi:adenine phosphoribosyltransferase
MADAPSAEELRAAIPWIDGHADVWALLGDAALLARCVRAMVRPYEGDGVTHVAGIESRGFVLGGAAAVALGAGFVAVRKATGHLPGRVLTEETGRDYKRTVERLRVQAGALRPGARVLLVDDWVETGSQLRAARVLLERAGATVVGATVLVDQADPGVPAALAKFRALARAQEPADGA